MHKTHYHQERYPHISRSNKAPCLSGPLHKKECLLATHLYTIGDTDFRQLPFSGAFHGTYLLLHQCN